MKRFPRLKDIFPRALYLYKLEEDYTYRLSDYTGEYFKESDLANLLQNLEKPINFYSEDMKEKVCTLRLQITPKGEMTVFKGYAWDGNSPKYSFLDLFCVGTPDGAIAENKPLTYYASLAHDALGQFKGHPNMPKIFYEAVGTEKKGNRGRRGRDGLYFELLKASDFSCRRLYYVLLSNIGPSFDRSSKASKAVTELSSKKGSIGYAMAAATAVVTVLFLNGMF